MLSLRGKAVKVLLVVLLLLTTIPFHSLFVLAENDLDPVDIENTPTENSADNMTTSMISFFREDRTNLAVSNVTRDEILVYGVFLSNFFVPWQTTLKDIKDDDSANSIPSNMAVKFFSSSEKSKDIAGLNGKLYDAISKVLGFSHQEFGLYSEPPSSSGQATPMSGEDLYKKIAGVGKSQIYGNNGQVLLDLADKGTQGAFQILFGINPDYMLDPNRGLRALTAIYMDGLGNIWGTKGDSDPDDYILVLPASMNPVVFSQNPTNTKLPINNVFGTGAVLTLKRDILSSANVATPYYNLKGYLASNNYNRDNMLTIFGVQSPSTKIGNSNQIISGGGDAGIVESVKKFIKEDASDRRTSVGSHIMLSIDPTKTPSIDTYVKNDTSLSEDQRGNVVDFFITTRSYRVEELIDELYYFDVPNASSSQVASGGEGSFANVEDLVKRQKMFTKEFDKGQFYFYDNSYSASPFNSFLNGYYSASDKDTYLRNYLPNAKSAQAGSKSLTALKSLLDTGGFGNSSLSDAKGALRLINGDNGNVFGLVKASDQTSQVSFVKKTWGIFGGKFRPTAFGLTKNDSILTMMSDASNDDSFWSLFTKYNAQVSKPFEVNYQGGTINSVTGSDGLKLATYLHNAYTYRIFSVNSTYASRISGMLAGTSYQTAFGENATLRTSIMNDVNHFPGIYWGYMVEMLKIKPNPDGEGFAPLTPYRNQHLPSMEIDVMGSILDLNKVFGEAGVVASEDKTLEEMQRDIIKKIYGLLSDDQNPYRDKLVKSIQDSWIVSTHRSITGSWVGDVLSVSTGANDSYTSIVGFINTPSLIDLPLTSWVLKDYIYIYILLMLIILIAIIMMVMVGSRTLSQGVLLVFLLAFILILPQFIVTNVINMTNAVSDKLYSDKYNYWAIIQHQQAESSLRGSRVTGNEMDYTVAKNMEMAKNIYSTDVGVRVKWMSPKKDDRFDAMFNKDEVSRGLGENLTIFKWLFSSYFHQEEYVHSDPLATYLYRPYNAIALEAFESYETLKSTSVSRQSVVDGVKSSSSGVAYIPDYRFNLYYDPEGEIEYTEEQIERIKEVAMYTADKEKTEEEISNYRYWILNSEDLNRSIFTSNFSMTDAGFTGDTSNPYYSAFSLTTESPFYYFYNVFKYRYADSESNLDFKSALLKKEIFKATSTDRTVNNKTRDFLDLEGLFTYYIPYLQQANEYVYGWTDIHGKNVDMYDFENGIAPEDEVVNERFLAEKTKKENLKNVWKLYTPWVDQLYSLGVLDQKATVADKKVYIEDALNPSAYQQQGRPMIFSEADMYAKSYKYGDLSDVERRIQDTLENTYKDLMYLTNYYDFDDEVLVTVGAMMATFNFNRAFSEKSFIGESTMIYPQGFELKNFNYDAFMRLLLLNSTGESLMAEKDLYVRVLDKTSIFTGILLIICDLLAVIFIPALKIIVLILLFFLTLFLVTSTVLSPPEKIVKTILKIIGVPILIFMVSSIVFAYILSLLMGEGMVGYVGSRLPTLGVSDPTIVMLGVVIAGLVYMFILFKLVIMLIQGIKTSFKTSLLVSLGLVAGVATMMVSIIKGGYKTGKSVGRLSRSYSGGSSSSVNESNSGSTEKEDKNDSNTDNYREDRLNKGRYRSSPDSYERDYKFEEEISDLSSGKNKNRENKDTKEEVDIKPQKQERTDSKQEEKDKTKGNNVDYRG